MTKNRLRIPQGTEAFYLEEAYAHRELLRRFEDECRSWGYQPVETPVFDFQELYRGLDDRMAEFSYRLVDRDGDVLVLRSDVTLFLARQMGMIVQQHDLPVRVYYGDTILRHEDPNDLSKNEFFQIGAELIGAAGADADAEMMLLLLDAVDRLGAPDTVLHVGSRDLLRQSSRSESFAEAVAARDRPAVAREIRDAGADAERSEAVASLYGFIGSAEELKSHLQDLRGLAPGEILAMDHLFQLWDRLESVGRSHRIRIDLSEVGDREYYSGIVFHLYDEGADAPLAAGGRYDELLGRFGSDAPSVGFSIMLRRLQSRLAPDALPRTPEVVKAAGRSFGERVKAAERERSRGKVVRL